MPRVGRALQRGASATARRPQREAIDSTSARDPRAAMHPPTPCPFPKQLSSLPPVKHNTSRPAPASEIETATERKFVTVLFVDVKGSMDLSSAIELEEWWSLIAGLFELMCESVYQFDGWVASFTGDGIKAVFERYAAADDHAVRACDAALWLRDAICAPAADLRIEHGLDLSVRVGINSGEVLTGTIGDRYRRYFTANGYAVALAKRMEALALPGRIYLSEHTAALVTGAFQLLDLGPFEVKGADTPVGVFELVGSEWRWRPRTQPGTEASADRLGWLKPRDTPTHVLLPGRVGHDPPRPIAPIRSPRAAREEYGVTRSI